MKKKTKEYFKKCLICEKELKVVNKTTLNVLCTRCCNGWGLSCEGYAKRNILFEEWQPRGIGMKRDNNKYERYTGQHKFQAYFNSFIAQDRY